MAEESESVKSAPFGTTVLENILKSDGERGERKRGVKGKV